MDGKLNSEIRSKCITVCLIGLGAIGSSVVRMLEGESELTVAGALVRRPRVRNDLYDFRIVSSLDELLELGPDVVAEVAGHSALMSYGPAILRFRSDLVITSVGALAHQDFLDELQAAAAATGKSVEIVAGAIGALDAIAAASLGGLENVSYLVRRPPEDHLPQAELSGPPTETEVFSGSAREAALKYPEKLNVAVALGLAGLGLDRTEVRVVIDPTVESVCHEIVAQGHFGALRMNIVNSVAGSGSPSRLVAMSVVRALRFRPWSPIRIV